MDAEELARRVLAGQPRAGARAISLLENGDPAGDELARRIFPSTGKARVLGITGPPGAGKSTLVDGIVAAYRERGCRVAVLAVDPSSPFSGGALLGDRIRMGASDPQVFFRSMASRGHLGGLALAVPAALRVLDAMGFEIVLVETVGVGQSEVAIVDVADCTLLVCVPGAGDSVQMLKAGVMEIGDVFAVNKCDRDGAEQLVREIEAMLALRGDAEKPPVLRTRADRRQGLPELVAAVDAHWARSEASGELERRRLAHLQREALELVACQARRHVMGRLDPELSESLVEALRTRQLDPAGAARAVLAHGLGAATEPDPAG